MNGNVTEVITMPYQLIERLNLFITVRFDTKKDKKNINSESSGITIAEAVKNNT